MSLQSAWVKLPAGKRKIIAVSCILAVGLALIAVFQVEPKKEEKYVAKRDLVSNVFTSNNTRNQSLDSLAGQLANLRKENHELTRRLESLEAKDIRKDIKDAVSKVETQIRAQEAEFSDLQKRFKTFSESEVVKMVQAPVQNEQEPVETEEKNERPKKQRQNKEAKATTPPSAFGEDQDSLFNVEPPTAETRKAARALQLSVTSEEVPEVKVKTRKKKSTDSNLYIPAGSILTGTILTGGEFPTNKGAFDNPTPLLVRLSKEAILPNRFRSDVRDCFLLAGGAGDLASERAKIRGETISCVRNDGSVIESRLDSYVAGEDGKAGIKGRLVSKQGQMIARSLVAGFAGGMAEAFDVNPVPVLSTTIDSKTPFQSAMSKDAVQGAAMKGASKSLDRIAQFYLDMAEDMFPVVEVVAGRQVDIVVTTGTSLKVSASSEKN